MTYWMKSIKKYGSLWLKPPTLWMLLAFLTIFVVGIGLRTYHFREWLHFGSDQARDAILVERVVRGEQSWPLLGMEAGNTRFDLGPAYYYFQILSAKIFGARPEAMAYPDVLLSILTLPLAYVLFRKLFDSTLSVVLTGLYAISFYVVEYSRFAWNPNVIPFFVGIFLLALAEFLESQEQTKWRWVTTLGIVIGIGVQLHTILLFLFPAVLLVVALFFLKKRSGVLLRVGAVLGIAFVLNVPQILSEIQTNGENTKLFLHAFTDRSQSGGSRFLESLETNILCHTQANAHILSGQGQHGVCNFPELLERPKRLFKTADRMMSFGGVMLSIVFSVVGYGLLILGAMKETDPKQKIFFRVLTLYAGLSFVVLFSVIRDAPLRYFIHVTFIPLFLLGLLLVRMRALFPRWYVPIGVLVCAGLAISNGRVIAVEAKQLASGLRGDSGFVVLGEAERMVDYMKKQSAPWKEADLTGGTAYFSIYYKSLKYIAAREGFDIRFADRKNPPISNRPYFFIGNHSNPKKQFDIEGYDLINQRDFGNMGIYQLRSVQLRTEKQTSLSQ